MKHRCQLFLLHFAGGNSYSFNFLKNHINSDIDFIPLELPGRGDRFKEKFLKTKVAVVKDYVSQIVKLRNNQPYIIFGHSMGATIGLAVVKEMEDINDSPCFLIVSGNAGPGVEDFNRKKEKRYLMGDVDFKTVLREMGGVPEEALNNDELFTFFSPIMRADFEVLEGDGNSKFGENINLGTPIYALMGSKEKNKDKIENWDRFTSKDLISEVLPGNHFFIHDNAKQLATIIISCYALQFQS